MLKKYKYVLDCQTKQEIKLRTIQIFPFRKIPFFSIPLKNGFFLFGIFRTNSPNNAVWNSLTLNSPSRRHRPRPRPPVALALPSPSSRHPHIVNIKYSPKQPPPAPNRTAARGGGESDDEGSGGDTSSDGGDTSSDGNGGRRRRRR